MADVARRIQSARPLPGAGRSRARARARRAPAAGAARGGGAPGRVGPVDGASGRGIARSSTAIATGPRLSGARRRGRRNGRGCCPGYVLEESEQDRARLTLVWALALAAAVAIGPEGARGHRRRAWPSPRSGSSWRRGIASRLSSARTEGRDAVRVIGRPALARSGMGADARRARGVDDRTCSTWGPTYEPHRAPRRCGDRRPPPPSSRGLRGRYPGRARPVGAAATKPFLGTGPRSGGVHARRLALSPDGLGGLLSTTEKETTLRVEGGGPFIIKDIRLERPQPFRRGAV